MVKLFFKLLFLILFVLKLFGFTILDLFISPYYLKIYFYVGCTLTIIYQLLSIYLLHRFYKNNIKISEILPNF